MRRSRRLPPLRWRPPPEQSARATGAAVPGRRVVDPRVRRGHRELAHHLVREVGNHDGPGGRGGRGPRRLHARRHLLRRDDRAAHGARGPRPSGRRGRGRHRGAGAHLPGGLPPGGLAAPGTSRHGQGAVRPARERPAARPAAARPGRVPPEAEGLDRPGCAAGAPGGGADSHAGALRHRGRRAPARDGPDLPRADAELHPAVRLGRRTRADLRPSRGAGRRDRGLRRPPGGLHLGGGGLMRFSLWSPMEYASEGLPPGWPVPGRNWEPARGAEALQRAFGLYDLAVDGGFDMVTVAEHHYGGSLVPSPTVMAAALAQRYPEVKIGILGPILPLAQPIRVAEEIAMVDVLSGGRTVVGFFRGIPNEHLVYGVPTAVTRELFEEALALIVRAWTEPETFGWEGRHYRFRTISPMPRPLQQPHPPLVSGATTPEAARFAAARGFLLGIFGAVVPPGRAAELVRAFRAAGGSEDVLYRARLYVAPTDEEAEVDVHAYGLGDMRPLIAPAPPRPEFCGSPVTVLRQLRESSQAIGWEILDGLFTMPHLPHAKARRSLELFVKEVVPALKSRR